MPLPVNIPNLQDPELYDVLRKMALFAATLNDILVTGSDFPTSGKRKFFYNTGDKNLYFYTADSTVGTNGWKVLG